MKTRDKDKQFENFIHTHQRLLIKVAASYSYNREDQHDLIQDMTFQLWRSFDSYNPELRASTWIYRVALNVAISWLRKKTSDRSRSVGPNDVGAETSINYPQDESLDLMRLLKKLGKFDRALMILYLEGMSYEEISGVLNISASNAGTKISRLKTQMINDFQKGAH